MKFCILIDNHTESTLTPEWGLAVWITYNGTSLLLDGGTSGIFTENARKMGIDLSMTQIAVLSHAHYDHANGLAAFLDSSPQAKLYVRKSTAENCYDCSGEAPRYIGIQEGFLKKYADRIIYAEGDYPLAPDRTPGITLIPHKTPNLDRLGKQIGMYIKTTEGMHPETFAHEQSLVFETPEGLVIFNSCSHAGADNIITEIAHTYPGRNIYAYIGGLHLYKASDDEILSFAERIRRTGIQKIYTGHCTGEHAVGLLRAQLGDIIQTIYTGMEVVL